jgi:uncharacterized secreted protein with C-terminal beta-propeller domain
MNQTANIFMLIFLPLLLRGQVNWDATSIWLNQGEIIQVEAPEYSRQVRVSLMDSKTKEWRIWQTSHIPEDANGSIYFRVPHHIQRSKVRFEWNGYDPLPYSFYTGKSNFSTRATDPGERNNFLARTELAHAEVMYMDLPGKVEEDESSEVEESDIWKLIGNTLYFFNQRRGLQILDLSNPTAPEFIARYRLPASGEQMYVSEDGEFIFLFVTPPHQAWPYHSNLQILQFEDGTIRKVTDIKLAGHYRDSRMVGETLHIVCEKWENETTSWNGWNFNYSSVLTSFDLDNPKEVEKISEITLAGSPQVTYATNQHLVVVTRDPKDYYNGHLARVFDLNDLSKVPQELSIIQAGGRILDKFKIRISGDTITLISQAIRNSNWNSRYSLLENFNIKTGELQGSLELAERETLYATKFDGHYAYIVTFLRVDPLFIVDLRDPSNPNLLSELIVPGWSEYLEVLDDQLFAVGVENSQVTASLFDISDKSNPFLSQRFYMGDENEYSWSEANYDEKAIGKVPPEGLFFIPYQTWAEGNELNKLQILKHENGLLEKGGQIDHRVVARRSFTDTTGHYLFSISGEELVVSNILDTNNAFEVRRLALAWTTERTHIFGENTLQIESTPTNGWGWGYISQEQNVTIRLTPTTDFDELLYQMDAGAGNLLGSLADGNLAHLAIHNQGKLIYKIFEVDEEEIKLLAEIETKTMSTPIPSAFEGFILENNQICWATKAASQSNIHPYLRMSAEIASDFFYPYPYNSTSVLDIQLFSFETGMVNSTIAMESNASLLIMGSQIRGPFKIGDKLLYGSSKEVDHYFNYFTVSENNSTLFQIDISNPQFPVLEEPIPVPGLLTGAQANQVVDGTGYLYFENQNVQLGNFRPVPLFLGDSINLKEFGRSMTVCAYDGSNLYFLDELDLSETTGPIAINNDFMYIAHSQRNEKGVDAYRVQENGSLLLMDTLFASHNIQELLTEETVLVGKSISGIHTSQQLWEWPTHSLSGNFYLNLKNFSASSTGLAISSGNYGVEWIPTPNNQTQTSQSNPYNFISPPPDAFVTQVLVPYYNPTTGESWTSETGGWTAPEGWIKGTREEYDANQKSNSRRSGSFNDWQELNTENIYVFELEEAPIFFDANATKAWKFRPNTAIDHQVEKLDGSWKKQTWFGNFYDLSFPWIYHTELQWLYFSESSHGSFWLWSKELGWIWTNASAFPYCFSNSNVGWLYLDLKDRTSLRYYNFKSEDWFKLN